MEEKNREKRVIKISLPIAIIVTAIILSVIATSAILYEKGGFDFLLADISQSDISNLATKTEEFGEEELLEQPSKKQQLELEQARLGAERAEQEAKALRQELEQERLKLERQQAQQEAEEQRRQEELEAQRLAEEQRRQEELEAQRLAEEQRRRGELEQELKIEKCKAQAQLEIDKFKKELNQMYLQGLEALKDWERAILDAQIAYSECILEPLPEDLIGAPPDLQNQYRESKCNYYLERKKQLEKELQQERNKLDTIFKTAEKMGETEYSRIYLECLNR